MPSVEQPAPISNVSQNSNISSEVTSNQNIDFIRLLIGNGRGTRIVGEDGPINSEIFIQNIIRYGTTFNNRFFVGIDGPGFIYPSNNFLDSLSANPLLGALGVISPGLAGAASLISVGASLFGSFDAENSSQVNSNYDSYQRLSILCNNASFPKTDIKTDKLELIPSVQESIAKYRDFSGNSTFTLKFYNSSSMYERNYFESWMNTIVNMKTGISNYYDEYAKPFSISVLKLPINSFGPDTPPRLFGQKTVQVENGFGGNTMSGFIYGVKYMECFPISINSVEFSYSQKQITETEVTFAYKYYLSPSNIRFMNSNISPTSPYSQYLNVLSDIINNKGKVSYDPQQNNTDNLASAINGTVSRITNVAAAIQQIY